MKPTPPKKHMTPKERVLLAHPDAFAERDGGGWQVFRPITIKNYGPGMRMLGRPGMKVEWAAWRSAARSLP